MFEINDAKILGAIGFQADIYVPNQGNKGYSEFIQAYLHGE